jgi:hypothetical protein
LAEGIKGMNDGRGHALSGESRLTKFYKEGSIGTSFSLRSAITGLAIGMASFAVSGVSIQEPITTQLVDQEGDVRGEIKVDGTTAKVVHDGETMTSISSLLLDMINHRIPDIADPHFPVNLDMDAPPLTVAPKTKINLDFDENYSNCDSLPLNRYLAEVCEPQFLPKKLEAIQGWQRSHHHSVGSDEKPERVYDTMLAF